MSAAIDQLAYGADDIRRLIVLAAGNIRDGITPHNYPDRNDVEPIENPAQAWNALTGTCEEIDPGITTVTVTNKFVTIH